MSVAGSVSFSLTHYQVPELPLQTRHNHNNPNSLHTVPTRDDCRTPGTLPLSATSADFTLPSKPLPRKQPGLLPPLGHIEKVSVASDESPVLSFDRSLLSTEFNRQFESQGDHAGRTSPRDQVPVFPPSPLEMQEPNEGTQGESQKHAPKRQKKKERDRERKRTERSNTSQDYEKICELLNVPLNPKKTLASRSECLCVHLVGDIERFIVLHAIEALVEQRKDYFDLRRQVEEVEAGLKFSIGELARLTTNTDPQY